MKNILLILILLLSTIYLHAQTGLDKYIKSRFIDPETGKEIVEIVVPGVAPNQIVFQPIAIPSRAAVVLTNVPALNWCFGCSATSAAMIAGYYDNNGYPNMYVGPTNNGVMPLTNNGWGNWTDPAGASRDQCPLSATRNGLDSRTTTGHVDRFWFGVDHSGDDPYGSGDPTGTYELCTADYMGTNQDWWNNTDGATTFYNYTDGSALENYSGAEGNSGTAKKRDGARGFRLFLESRGYTVIHNYNQYINGFDPDGAGALPVITSGFTYDNYKAEINAGRPVLIQVTGHTMLGVGYDNASSTIYIHDTWDHSSHTMTWGGSYSGRTHYGVGVFQIEAAQTTSAPTISPAGGTYTSAQSCTLSVTNPPTSGTTTIRYTTDGSEPTINSTAYTVPINIPVQTVMTIKAKTFSTIWPESSTSSATFTVFDKAATPTFSPAAGTYTSFQNVSFNCSTPGVAYYYRTDGIDPTLINGTLFSSENPIHVNQDMTIKVIAYKPNWAVSDVATGNYYIEPGAPTLLSPADHTTGVSYDTQLTWSPPISGAVPAGYKVYFGTSANPTNSVDVGNVLAWTPNPHVNWNTQYFWKVVGYTTGRGDGDFSQEWDFTVSNGDTGTGAGGNGGAGPAVVDVAPLNISGTVVDPDVTVTSSAEVTVSIVVDNTALNAGTLPNPTNVSLSYRMSITGSGEMNFTLGFDGLDVLRLQPDEVACYDGSWGIISTPSWNYTNETVTFTKNIAPGRAEIEFVLNNGDSTLPVELSSFTAIPTSDNQVQVNWTTQSESNVLGYNIYRDTDFLIEGAQLLTNALIPAHNQAIEYHYSFTDTQISEVPVYYYWLESIDLDNTNEFFGPVTVNFSSYYYEMTDQKIVIENHSKVDLQWTTADESNILIGFDIYRSPVRNFAAAEKVNSEAIYSANSQNEHTYTFTDTKVTIGEDYFYWIAGLSWENILTISDPIEVYLPNLELSSFSANVTNDREVQVSWQTDFEIELVHFELQRSEDISFQDFVTINDEPISAENSDFNSYLITDKSAEKGESYYYKLISTNQNGRIVNFYSNQVDYGFIDLLYSNYPNPFSSGINRSAGTTIRFELGEKSNGILEIFNLKGQRVRSWNISSYETGEHSIIWNGKDEYNGKVASGIYLYRLTTNNISQTRKMLIMK